MAVLTVKGARASGAQASNIVLLCKIAKSMGANNSQLSGALATMMQESDCINMKGGDRDSVGLFQQRPSCGWGSYAQCSDPNYAIRKFLTPYLSYCRQGMAPIAASHKVQMSAFPTAPAQWYNESWKDVGIVLGGKDITDVTIGKIPGVPSGGGSATVVRNLPYEFSRGTPDKAETSWDCMGRLADEVGWRRFVKAGALWFVSEAWLAKQPARFVFATGKQGVISITFSADSRSNAAECTVTALALRWSVLPGDVVKVQGQGPADGVWLVSDVRRTLGAETTDITLKRPAPKLPEPAPQTSTTNVSVGGGPSIPTLSTVNAKGAPNQAARAYYFADIMSRWNLPYVYGGLHGPGGMNVAHPPNADCSSSCCWVLHKAGLYNSDSAMVSGDFMTRWGQAGDGKYMTIHCSPEHVWIQWHGLGPAWRFDTSPWNSGPSGPHQRTGPRSTATFVSRHWPNL